MPQFDPAMLGGAVCGMVFGLVLALAVGAVIVRAAVGLYNRVAGGQYTEAGVPDPSFGWAMLIVLVGSILNGVIDFVVGLVLLNVLGVQTREDVLAAQQLARLVTLPINYLVLSLTLSGMLPTTFGRGLLIALFVFLIAFVIVLIIVVGLVVAGFGLGLSLRQ